MTQEGKSRICSLLNLERKNLKRISFVKKASAGNATQVIGWFCSKSGQREALYSWENLHSKRWMDLIKMWQGSCVEFYYNVQLVIVVSWCCSLWFIHFQQQHPDYSFVFCLFFPWLTTFMWKLWDHSKTCITVSNIHQYNGIFTHYPFS